MEARSSELVLREPPAWSTPRRERRKEEAHKVPNNVAVMARLNEEAAINSVNQIAEAEDEHD